MSADKSAKVWEISDDGNAEVIKTLASPEADAVEDMLVGCLWQKDHLSAQIKCLDAAEEQIITCGYDNKVAYFKQMHASTWFRFYRFQTEHSCGLKVSSLVD